MFPVLHHLISILHRLLPGPSVALLWSVLPHSSFCFVRSTSDTWILRILDGDEWQCKPGIIDNDCITFRCRKMFLQLSVKFTISQTYLSSMSCSAHGKIDNNIPLVTSHCSQQKMIWGLENLEWKLSQGGHAKSSRHILLHVLLTLNNAWQKYMWTHSQSDIYSNETYHIFNCSGFFLSTVSPQIMKTETAVLP